MNMRDNRDESPQSVGILMSAFSKGQGNNVNPALIEAYS